MNIQTTPFVNRVGERISEQLRDSESHPILRQATVRICSSGKRARPRLVYLLGKTVGANEQSLAKVATAAELIHSASLLHDDVIDEGKIRRGMPTANVTWGNSAAILSGDLLLTMALRELASLPRPITDRAISTIQQMTVASMREVSSIGNFAIERGEWTKIAEGKTASLMSWIGYSAGLLAENHDASTRFDRACHHLGVAFQIADDLHDVTETDSTKIPFADLRNGNPSIVTLEAIKRAPEMLTALMKEELPMSQNRAEMFGKKVVETGAIVGGASLLFNEIGMGLSKLKPFENNRYAQKVLSWGKSLGENFLGVIND